MELKSLVANYATKVSGKIEVNLEGLEKNKGFRSQVIEEIVKKVKETPHACVLFPSYSTETDSPLGSLINELALTLQVETLVTGNLQQLKNLRVPATDVIIIKQSFRTGATLKKQIEKIKAMGCNVNVICMIAHSGAAVERFSYENNVPVTTVINTDELDYIG